jgi:hypothetical protein
MTLSLDMTTLFDNAELIINMLWPIAAISIGFGLGFVILKMIQGALGRIGGGR